MTGLIYGEEGADMDRISVRKAGEKDVEALAHILVTSFKTAFADIIREETIDRCANEENCRNMFAAICASGEGQFYIAELDGIFLLHRLLLSPVAESPYGERIAEIKSYKTDCSSRFC